MVGSLVLNVANRDAGTLAVMAATLQEVSGGRLLLGIGAGGGIDTPYAAEQLALGRAVPGDAARRRAVEATIGTLRQVWSGATGGAAGFLRPDPPPPVIVGGFGPKMAELAGRVGDGINAPPRPVAGSPDRHRPGGPRPAAARTRSGSSSRPPDRPPTSDSIASVCTVSITMVRPAVHRRRSPARRCSRAALSRLRGTAVAGDQATTVVGAGDEGAPDEQHGDHQTNARALTEHRYILPR